MRQWLRDWARAHPRRGFRNAYADARGEGWNVNHKKIQRLWREEGLRVPQRRRRRRTGISTAPDRQAADAPNTVWAVDFQFDATTDGRPIKLMSIIDEHTRECLTNLVDRSDTAEVLIDELDRLALTRGYPAVLRCDNGPRAGLRRDGRLGRRTASDSPSSRPDEAAVLHRMGYCAPWLTRLARVPSAWAVRSERIEGKVVWFHGESDEASGYHGSWSICAPTVRSSPATASPS